MTSVGMMASAVGGGSCTAVLAEPFTNYTANGWVLTSAPTIVTGRTGNAANITGTTQRADFNLPAPAQSDTITVGFAWRRTDATTAARLICRLMSDGGAVEHTRLQIDLSGNTITVNRASIQIALGSWTSVINTWYYIEWQVKLHDTAGFAIVRVDGVELINATGLDTKNAGTKTVYDQLRIIAGAVGATQQYDDLYLSTGAGCTFQGDHTIP